MEEDKRNKLKQELESLLHKQLVKGDTWYLIDTHWFKQLKVFIGSDSPVTFDSGGGKTSPVKNGPGGEGGGDPVSQPGPIDNGPIFKEDGTDIREHMIDDLDYQLVPEDVWKLLVDNFSLTQGQEPIARKVIEHGMFVKHCKVEVYYIEIQVAQDSNLTNIKKAKFSKGDTIESIANTMRKMFSISDNVEIRLWNKYTADSYEQLTNLENTAQDAGLYGGQLLVIEAKNDDGSWPRGGNKSTNSALKTITNSGPSSMTASNSSPSTSSPTGAVEKQQQKEVTVSTRYNFGSYSDGGHTEKAQPGLCGLSNLGNTCFMNSIIQGLSNCPPITDYFANDNYIEDINDENPLGMKGEIARAFGELVKSMWSGKYSYFVPRNFKMAVGRFAPQFSGYQQQDSQELLTFLLDGLHEDLNRIKKKPYIELKDIDDKKDDEVAAEAWDIYKKRNDSVILDLFHGLLKSTVVCPECPKISVTFDPFCYLSLPLPVRKERKVEVFLVYMDPAKCPKQFKVTVAKNGCMKDLCDALSQMIGGEVASNKMIVTDVYNHRFHKIYATDEGLSHILDRDDIFVYEVPTTDFDDSQTVIVPVYLREKKSSMSYSPSNLFGQPLLIGVPRESTNYDQLYELVLSHLARYVSSPKANPSGGGQAATEWWKPDPALQNGIAHGKDDGGKGQSNGQAGAEDSSEEATTPSSEGIPISSLLENNEEEDDEEMAVEEEDGKGPPKYFVMNFVNSYGNAQLEQLVNDGKPLKITGKSYLSLDWHCKAKELFYNEKEAEAFAQDQSLETKPLQKKQVRLEECLELYTSKEKLGENDAWYCPSCKKHQQATKKFDIWSLPALLVISLKRFSYNRYWRDKLDTHVEFPVKDLDMAPYVINSKHGPAIYDLVAVSNHYGGMGGGHYTAYAKNKDDGHWYYFDDSSVTASSEEAVVSKAAYVLFYQRRDLAEQLSAKVAGRSAARNSNCNGKATSGKVNGDALSEEAMDTN